jgi:hypothetical protein
VFLYQNIFSYRHHIIGSFLFLFLRVLAFLLRASRLLGRHSTTWPTSQPFLLWLFLVLLLAQAYLHYNSPILPLPPSLEWQMHMTTLFSH